MCIVMFSRGKLTASKPLGWFSLVASFIASQMGSSLFIYTAQFAYSDGLLAILYPLGTSLGLLALCLGIGAKIRNLQLADISDVFEKYYQSGTLKKVSCFLLTTSLVGLLVAQAVALKELLEAMGIAHESVFIAIWLSIIFCTVYGAMKTAAWTEILQVILVVGVLSAAYFFSPASSYKGLSFLHTMQGEAPEGFNDKLFSYLLVPCFVIFLEPELIQTIPASRSKRKIWTAALFAGLLVMILSLASVYCGMAGKHPVATQSEMSAPIGSAANPKLATCCTFLLLVAFACTSSSLLKSLSLKFRELFSQSNYPKSEPWTRTLFLGIGVLLVSYISTNNVSALILDSYRLVSACLLVPMVAAAFSRSPKEIPKTAAGMSMLFGACTFGICYVLGACCFTEIFSVAASWIGFLLGNRLSTEKQSTRKPWL